MGQVLVLICLATCSRCDFLNDKAINDILVRAPYDDWLKVDLSDTIDLDGGE